jgi:hypothetical protein
VVLLAQFVWPVMPVATSVSLIALGATIATITRTANNVSRAQVTLNLFVYVSLYLLLIGAICDASLRGPRNGLTLLQGVDFGVSAMVMALVMRSCIAAIVKSGDVRVR